MLVGDLQGGGARFAAVVKELFDHDIITLTRRTLRADVGLGPAGSAAPDDSTATPEQLQACQRWLDLLEAGSGAAGAGGGELNDKRLHRFDRALTAASSSTVLHLFRHRFLEYAEATPPACAWASAVRRAHSCTRVAVCVRCQAA